MPPAPFPGLTRSTRRVIEWSGVSTILATPFENDGTLDVAGIPRLVERTVSDS